MPLCACTSLPPAATSKNNKTNLLVVDMVALEHQQVLLGRVLHRPQANHTVLVEVCHNIQAVVVSRPTQTRRCKNPPPRFLRWSDLRLGGLDDGVGAAVAAPPHAGLLEPAPALESEEAITSRERWSSAPPDSATGRTAHCGWFAARVRGCMSPSEREREVQAPGIFSL